MRKSMSLRFFLLIITTLTLNTAYPANTNRITDPVILGAGEKLFQTNCAVCHGIKAQGNGEDWNKPNTDGKSPPPPLNGTAHAWHHPVGALMKTIRNGTMPIGGTMPAWKNTLSNEEIFSIIVWFSSLWPDEIYNEWMRRNKQ